MARRRTLNQRRLTRRQVEELLASGAKLRADITAQLKDSLPQSRVYELTGDRFLLVFGDVSLQGKGDIYAADVFDRFLRWCARADDDVKHGRQGSTAHWAYYSALKEDLISRIDPLIAELRSRMSQTAASLDLSYKSLDLVSDYIERIGIERATLELYDHLVAYVGEVLRPRIEGRWQIARGHASPYPYLVGAKCDPVMPINVVWHELSGYGPANFRTAAANEIRRARKPPDASVNAATSVRAAAPRGALATLPGDSYEVTKRWADGRPWFVTFREDIEVAGIPCCRGEAWFARDGGLIGAALSREWQFGTRRFGANSFFRFHRAQQDGRLNDVTLGGDQEIDGLPCLGGTTVWFHANGRVSALHLAADRDVDGIPCASGKDLHVALNFHKNGRLAAAVLAKDHSVAGRSFPRGTRVSFDDKGYLINVATAGS
jgi:hypothetical protein